MTNELKEYVKQHQATFRMWVENKEQLQKGMDILKPIIPEYKEAYPVNNLDGNCKDCILDMLIWVLIQIKDEKPKKNAR